MVPFLFLISTAQAQVSQNFLNQTQPLYEGGFGAITTSVPDYPGSSNHRFRVVPFPYFVYRGKYLRADDEGTRARVLSSSWHEFGISFAFNFPVKSGDNPSRLGMPDLDALMGLGPRLLIRLRTRPTHQFNFIVESRALVSTDFRNRMEGRGISVEPRLSYWYRFSSLTTMYSHLSYEFGSAEYMRFFYNIRPEFATPQREAYTARAGLLERSIGVGVSQQLPQRFSLFIALGWRNQDLAANRHSPLVERKDNYALIAGLVWLFFESEEQVERLIAKPLQ